MNKRDQISRKDKITYIPLSKITPNKDQPRRHFNVAKLNELAASIRENGVLQPITVRQIDREYTLIAGERRLRAAHIAGLSHIPAIIVTADDKESATLALLENLQRDDLGFIEEAKAISHLMRICGYTQETVAKKLGKSQSAISNKLRLLKLSPEILNSLTSASLSERHARALLRLSSREEQLSALEFIIKNNLNVLQTDEYIDDLLNNHIRKKQPTQKKQQYIIKDMRLFYNSVGKAVETMRRAGFRTDIARDEDDTCINMNIKIFK